MCTSATSSSFSKASSFSSGTLLSISSVSCQSTTTTGLGGAGLSLTPPLSTEGLLAKSFSECFLSFSKDPSSLSFSKDFSSLSFSKDFFGALLAFFCLPPAPTTFVQPSSSSLSGSSFTSLSCSQVPSFAFLDLLSSPFSKNSSSFFSFALVFSKTFLSLLRFLLDEPEGFSSFPKDEDASFSKDAFSLACSNLSLALSAAFCRSSKCFSKHSGFLPDSPTGGAPSELACCCGLYHFLATCLCSCTPSSPTYSCAKATHHPWLCWLSQISRLGFSKPSHRQAFPNLSATLLLQEWGCKCLWVCSSWLCMCVMLVIRKKQSWKSWNPRFEGKCTCLKRFIYIYIYIAPT